MPHRFLSLALLALLVSACQSTDAAEQQQQLTLHREFARKYFENNQLVLAEQQADLGLEIESDDPQLRLMKAWIRQKRGGAEDVLLAERLFRDLVDDGDYRATLGLGQALERKGVLYWESAASVERGERPTKSSDPVARAEEMRQEARDFWHESVEWYEETLALKSGELQAVNGLQRVWALIGDLEQSLHWSNALLEQSEREIEYWRAELQRPDLRAVEEDECRRLLNASTALMVETHLVASTSLVQLGRRQEALPHLDRAIELAPDRAGSYSRRAQLNHDFGNVRAARADLEQFLRLSTLPVDHPDMRRAFDLLADCEVELQGADKSGG